MSGKGEAMSTITLDDGDVLNTAHVVKLTKLRNGEYKFLMTDGSIATGRTNEPESKIWPIVPAAAGYRGIITDVIDREHFFEERAVIGWRICPGGNYALLEGRSTEEGYAAIQEPNGLVTDCDGNRFCNIQAFKAAVADEDAAFLKAAA
ncbi:hypothetical protein G6N74_20670 [Mesorhizobium sp. CGMCC 1.15528]|uniref:Uncharacterized protein n=1 Tax=Mesorhizobium zhangyense TaxID=1776730 RepID=A0A7C9VEN8_9HYPH|nr:hypothetical protein [Mesorhizobium zhangyense]NGN43489.1 hypothetical protein [Mesorhizobium zhangyense]